MVQSHSETETVLAIRLAPLLQSAILQMAEEMASPVLFARSSSQVTEKKQLKALDLISFWWTKPTKLTPELKEVMFGNIYQSPFARLYLFLQNSSYEHIHHQPHCRSFVHLG
jgi:hypothetical protein